MKLITLGMWAWGAVTVLLGFFFLCVVVIAGVYIRPTATSYYFVEGAPGLLVGLFYSLKENGSLVAGILGFSGLAWAHFFQVSRAH